MSDAIYPGTFDPVTLGHLDVVERGSRLFHRLVVAVAQNLDKRPLFTPAERVEMLHAAIGDRFPNVSVTTFDGLAVDAARAGGFTVLLRGLRDVDDFVAETRMAGMNREMAPDVDTVFLSPSARHAHVASRLVREAVALGGDLSSLLPPGVPERLRARLAERSAAERSHPSTGGTA